MKKYIRYVFFIVTIVVFGILYSCERQDNDIEVVDTYVSTANDDVPKTTSISYYEETIKSICIHVTGCVVNPGVYKLPEGSRVYEAIVLAGGFSEEADRQYINQAAVLNDGQKLYIYSVEETETASGYTEADKEQEGVLLVNINTASKETLMTLPGIGEARAESIIAYREEKGGFKAIEDIMKVSGIKDAAFNKLKQFICTN